MKVTLFLITISFVLTAFEVKIISCFWISKNFNSFSPFNFLIVTLLYHTLSCIIHWYIVGINIILILYGQLYSLATVEYFNIRAFLSNVEYCHFALYKIFTNMSNLGFSTNSSNLLLKLTIYSLQIT